MKKQLAFPFPEKEQSKVVATLSALQRDGLERIDRHHCEVVIGIDEVGMGCWAGPVTVAAVAAKRWWRPFGVKDSKKLSPQRREQLLDDVIIPGVDFYRVFSMPASYIDEHGIENARKQLTESVGCLCRMFCPDALVVQDGDNAVPIDGSMKNVVFFPKADGLVPVVSAASILAKVTRDRHMKEAAKTWPQYDFQSNMGYHSAAHVNALTKFGLTPLHRRSYKPVQHYERLHAQLKQA